MDRLKRDTEALKAEAAPAAAADSKVKDTAAVNQKADLSAAAEKAEQAERHYKKNLASSVAFLDKCVEMMPWDWRARGIHHEFLIDHGMYEEAAAAIERSIAEDPENRAKYEPLLERAKAEIGRS
ncbi:hypothetical protein R80B4_02323 [Fibrobacteres bacterium R8-0-B4]